MKAAIYARVSTEKQEKQETINSQLLALREYAKNNNYDIREEYIDNGYSGELLDRPALDKLRDDAKNKLFSHILIHSPDRLSRKFIYNGLLQEELQKHGIGIVFLNRPDSKDTPEDNLLNGVQGIIAEYEKAKIIERTRRGRLYKAKSGLLIGSIAPYGYQYLKEKNTGRYKVVDKEARVVRLIFDLFVNKNLSIRAVARDLTRREIPPRQGKHWRTSSLHKILRNETYAGTTHYNKHIAAESKTNRNGVKYRRSKNTSMRLRPRDQWIPIVLPEDLMIIDRRMFTLAQDQLARNGELAARNVKYHYLLRGLVKCGKCDAPFYGTPCHSQLYYRCGNKSRTFPLPPECKAPMVKAESLEGIVWNKFCEAIKNPRLILEQVTGLKEKALNNPDLISAEYVEREIKDLGTEESRSLDAYREQIINMDQLRDQMNKISKKRSQLEQERAALAAKHARSTSAALIKKNLYECCEQISRRLDSIGDDFEAKRYLLSLALNKVILKDKQVRIRGIIPLYPASESPFGRIASTAPGCYDPRPPQPPKPF